MINAYVIKDDRNVLSKKIYKPGYAENILTGMERKTLVRGKINFDIGHCSSHQICNNTYLYVLIAELLLSLKRVKVLVKI